MLLTVFDYSVMEWVGVGGDDSRISCLCHQAGYRDLSCRFYRVVAQRVMYNFSTTARHVADGGARTPDV